MHLIQHVKTHTALPMGFIAVSFFIFLVNVAFVAIMVWIIMAIISVLLHLDSLVSVELNSERSSTSLTLGKGSLYLSAFQKIIHMFFLKRA